MFVDRLSLAFVCRSLSVCFHSFKRLCVNVRFSMEGHSGPESSSNLVEFGEKEIDFLLLFFRRILLRYIYLTWSAN